MKKILFLNHVSGIGGGSYALLGLLREIDRKQFEPMVLLKDDGPLVAEIKALNIEVETIHHIQQVPYNESIFSKIKFKEIILILLSLFDFYKYLRRNRPDVVYVNSMMLYPYLFVCKLLHIKSIIHVRENWPKGEHSIQRAMAVKSITKYADKIIAINKLSASIYDKVQYKTDIIYDWIDFSNRYEERPLNEIFEEDCSLLKVFVFTGGFTSIKGVVDVLDVFVHNMTENSYRLLILGKVVEHPDDYTKQALDLIKQDNRIKVIPPTYKLVHILQQAYCNLSYFKIPHANLALAESIILGLPCVASETPESIEYSDNGKLAVLYKLNDKKEFIAKVNYLISHYDEYKARVLKSQHVKDMFDKQKNISKFNTVLEKI